MIPYQLKLSGEDSPIDPQKGELISMMILFTSPMAM